jgi:hypothetical protein
MQLAKESTERVRPEGGMQLLTKTRIIIFRGLTEGKEVLWIP